MQDNFIREIQLTAMNLSLLYMRSNCFLPLFCGFRSWRFDQSFPESAVSLSSCGAASAAAASTTAPDAKPGKQSTCAFAALMLAVGLKAIARFLYTSALYVVHTPSPNH